MIQVLLILNTATDMSAFREVTLGARLRSLMLFISKECEQRTVAHPHSQTIFERTFGESPPCFLVLLLRVYYTQERPSFFEKKSLSIYKPV